MPTPKERSRIQARVIKRAKGMKGLAEALGISRQSIGNWSGIPDKHVEKIAEITGLEPKEIRPDIYDIDE